MREVLVSSNLGAGTSRGICPAGLLTYLFEHELACKGEAISCSVPHSLPITQPRSRLFPPSRS